MSNLDLFHIYVVVHVTLKKFGIKEVFIVYICTEKINLNNILVKYCRFFNPDERILHELKNIYYI